jgi:hypothetical protein
MQPKQIKDQKAESRNSGITMRHYRRSISQKPKTPALPTGDIHS